MKRIFRMYWWVWQGLPAALLFATLGVLTLGGMLAPLFLALEINAWWAALYLVMPLWLLMLGYLVELINNQIDRLERL